jgi:uncharacterized protein
MNSPSGEATRTLIVFGRLPCPGRSKTRLSPPFSPAKATLLYEAMLQDTLRTAAQFGPETRVLFAADTYKGGPARLPAGPEWPADIVQQQGPTLAKRLRACYGLTRLPALLIPTDTPQITARDLEDAFSWLTGSPRAVIGLTADGGFWCLGLRGVRADFLLGIDFGSPRCALDMVEVLRQADVSVLRLPTVLRDLDDADDCEIVARNWPDLGFSRRYRQLTSQP